MLYFLFHYIHLQVGVIIYSQITKLRKYTKLSKIKQIVPNHFLLVTPYWCFSYIRYSTAAEQYF